MSRPTTTPARRAKAPVRERPPDAWVELLRGHATLTRRMDAALRELHGLSLNEYEVLLQLGFADEGRLRRVDLAERLLITQGGVTRLLAGLERKGLVDRANCESDARVVYAELTAQGRRKLASARRAHLEDVRDQFSSRFSASELKALGELLSRLSDADAGAAAC
ncbi:MAG: MarR family transcriptional regulator [Actinomycetota bacterium]